MNFFYISVIKKDSSWDGLKATTVQSTPTKPVTIVDRQGETTSRDEVSSPKVPASEPVSGHVTTDTTDHTHDGLSTTITSNEGNLLELINPK